MEPNSAMEKIILSLILGGCIFKENFVENKIEESIFLCILFGFSIFNEIFAKNTGSNFFNSRQKISSGFTVGSILLPLSCFTHEFYKDYFWLSVLTAFFINTFAVTSFIFQKLRFGKNLLVSLIFSYFLAIIPFLLSSQSRT